MLAMLFKVMGMLKKNSPELFDDSHFEIRYPSHLNISYRTVKPVLQFPDGLVKPGFTVGTRGNGVDKPRWPEDLKTELIV